MADKVETERFKNSESTNDGSETAFQRFKTKFVVFEVRTKLLYF